MKHKREEKKHCPHASYRVVLNHLFQTKLDYRQKTQSWNALVFLHNSSHSTRGAVARLVIELMFLNGRHINRRHIREGAYVCSRDNRLRAHVIPPSNVSSRTSPERFLFASCLYTSLLSHLFFLESQRSKQSRPRGGAAGLRMCAEVQSKDCFVFSVLPKDFTLKDREMEISVCK